MKNDPDTSHDAWSRWLLHGRNGGDAAFEQFLRSEVEQYVDRILTRARLGPEMTLLDVGTGEGAVAFRAIERIGKTLRVILTDISAPLLGRARARAAELGVEDQCTFLECGADRLAGVGDQSVDVVATRSVLAYVRDKQRAVREFRRVLKAGGRISLAEPIFQDDAFYTCVLKTLAEATNPPPKDRLPKLLHRWRAAQFPDTQEGIAANPLTNFSERTLFDLARGAGFAPVHLELHMDLQRSPLPSWQVFLDTSPHPLAPPLRRILQETFNQEERDLLEAAYRPLVESGCGLAIHRMAYLDATRSDTLVTSQL